MKCFVWDHRKYNRAVPFQYNELVDNKFYENRRKIICKNIFVKICQFYTSHNNSYEDVCFLKTTQSHDLLLEHIFYTEVLSKTFCETWNNESDTAKLRS